MTHATSPAVLALAGRRDGVVAQSELLKAGLPHDLGSQEVAAGRWQRLLTGIYLTRAAPPTLSQRVQAAALALGPKAAITGNAGCVLRGVTGARQEDTEVAVLLPATVRRAAGAFVTVHRTTSWPAVTQLVRGTDVPVPVAVLTRCLTDALRQAPSLEGARELATTALRHEALDWAAVRSAVSVPGAPRGFLPRVVREIDDGVRSVPEAELHETLAAAAEKGQLPPYLLNPDVYLDGVLLGSPDAWFPGLGLGDEMDSRTWHDAPDQLDATLQRHERFRRAGLHLHHTTPTRYRRSPSEHVRALVSLIAERSGLAVPEPPRLVVRARGPLHPHRTPWEQVDARRWA